MVKMYSKGSKHPKSCTRICGKNTGSSEESFSKRGQGDPEIRDKISEIQADESEISGQESVPEERKSKTDEEVRRYIQELESSFDDLPEETDEKLKTRREIYKKKFLELEKKRFKGESLTPDEEMKHYDYNEIMFFPETPDFTPEMEKRVNEEIEENYIWSLKGHKHQNKVGLKREFREKTIKDLDFSELAEDNDYNGTLEEFLADDQRWEGIVVLKIERSTIVRVRMLNIYYLDNIYGGPFPLVIDLISDCFDLLADQPSKKDLSKIHDYELIDPDCHYYGIQSYTVSSSVYTWRREQRLKRESKLRQKRLERAIKKLKSL